MVVTYDSNGNVPFSLREYSQQNTRGTGSNQQMVVQDNERNERSAWQLISFGVMKCHSKGHPNAIAYSGFHVPIDAHCYRQLANLPDHPWRQYPILVSFLDVAPVGMWVAKCNSCGYPLDIACSGVQQCPNIVTKHFTSDLIITIGIHRILMCSLDLLGWPRQRRRRKPKLCAGVLGFRLRHPFAAILLRL